MIIESPPKLKPSNENLDPGGLETLSEQEQKLYIILWPRHRQAAISMDSFGDLYDQRSIQEDKRYVKEQERKFEDEENPETKGAQKRGELLEALISEQISYNNWLGREAKPIIPSRYDDIRNGVDLIVEFLHDPGISRLALNIDITSSAAKISKKVSKIKQEIKNGSLVMVKYFSSKHAQPKQRGELSGIPRVVIGVDAATMRQLSQLRLELHGLIKIIANKKEFQKYTEEARESIEKRFKEARSKLSKHRVQFLLLDQIEKQITVYIKYAIQQGQGRENVVRAYQSALKIIQNIKESKLEKVREKEPTLLAEIEENKNDKVFQALLSSLASFETI